MVCINEAPIRGFVPNSSWLPRTHMTSQFYSSTVLESLLALLPSDRMGIEGAGRTSPSLAAAAVREKAHRRLSAWEGGQAA
jgi:hypothetical protein